nr:MAG TPA: hypothetical protein [Caudoviricetes sp.]
MCGVSFYTFRNESARVNCTRANPESRALPSLRPDGAGGRTDAIPNELHRVRPNCRSSGEKPGHSGAKAEIIIREIIFRSSRSDPSGQVTGLYLREKSVRVRTGGTMTIYFEILAAYSSAAVA